MNCGNLKHLMYFDEKFDEKSEKLKKVLLCSKPYKEKPEGLQDISQVDLLQEDINRKCHIHVVVVQ